jgi:ferredoxin
MITSSGIAGELANFICQFGHHALPVISNLVNRNDEDCPVDKRQPPISHKYLAVRGGVGWFGFSGNVLTPEHGPNVVFASVVTDADLFPTDPLPPEDNYCDDCQACNASCPSGFFHQGRKKQVTVTIGGVDFTYTKRRSYARCSLVCSGHTGLHPSGAWSTWSPGRFPIPKKDEDLAPVSKEASEAWLNRPIVPGPAMQSPITFGKTHRDIPLTCGNCMHVCHPDKEERKRRLDLLKKGGVVIQLEDGRLEAVSRDEAEEHVAAMHPERRVLYEARHPEDFERERYLGTKNHSQNTKKKK